MNWSTACPDWESRIVDGRPLIPFGPLFPGEAAEAIAVFSALRAVDVAGRPTMGEISRQWITDFVGAVFGSYDAESGNRLIKEYLLSVAKKNSKSTTAAGIMLTALVRNWRDSAEFVILAPTIEVADNAFKPARDMVAADEELSALMHVQQHYRMITHRRTGATLKVVAADNEAVGGKKATAVLVDELWQFGIKHNAENMLLEATGGLAARKEGFVIYLTTQSEMPPAGVFKQKLQYARGVRDGRIDDKEFLPVLYEFPDAILKDARNPKHWYITNPNLGASVAPEFIERQLRVAGENGEESIQSILAKHLNVEIGLRLASDRWAGADYWEQQGARRVTLDYLLEHSDVIEIGLDGGGLDDLFGFAAIGREIETGDWLHWAHAWAHPSVLERRKSEAARFWDFESADELTIVKQMGDDVDQIVDRVMQIDDTGLLDRIGVDPVGIGSIVQELTDRGIDLARIVGISQGWKMTGAIKTLERKLADGTFWHGGTGLMAYCVGNAKVEPRGNAILITKQAAGSAKIDPLSATFNAVSLMSLNPEARGSVGDFLADPIIVNYARR